MSKELHHSKNAKKKPLLSLKEKKAAKLAKKQTRAQAGSVEAVK